MKKNTRVTTENNLQIYSSKYFEWIRSSKIIPFIGCLGLLSLVSIGMLFTSNYIKCGGVQENPFDKSTKPFEYTGYEQQVRYGDCKYSGFDSDHQDSFYKGCALAISNLNINKECKK